MIERAKSQEADASQKKSAYNSFKNQKPKSRNRWAPVLPGQKCKLNLDGIRRVDLICETMIREKRFIFRMKKILFQKKTSKPSTGPMTNSIKMVSLYYTSVIWLIHVHILGNNKNRNFHDVTQTIFKSWTKSQMLFLDWKSSVLMVRNKALVLRLQYHSWVLSKIFGLKSSLDIVIPSHMLEIYDFPKAVRTQDLLQVN